MAARVILLVAAMLLVTAAPAGAHDPLFLTDEQTTPETGPLLPDGTISFAVYGTLSGDGDQRGFEVVFTAGDRLLVEVLVPDLEPETSLSADELPRATVTAPDGTVTELAPDRREPFFEPFSNTSYVTIAGMDATAIAGTYQVTITSGAPSRFTVAVGTIESFLTPVERADNRIQTLADIAAPLSAWYSTPPSGTESADGPTSASADEGAAGGEPERPVEEPDLSEAGPRPAEDGVVEAEAEVVDAPEEVADGADELETRERGPAVTGSAAGSTGVDDDGDGRGVGWYVVLIAVAVAVVGAIVAIGWRRSTAAG